MNMAKKAKPGVRKPKATRAKKKPSFDRIVYRIEESRAGAGYESLCPELLITGFGDTAEDAKNALRRQVAEYLEDCEQLEVLDETLIQAGFYYNGEIWMSSEVEPAPEPKIRFIGRPAGEPAGETTTETTGETTRETPE